ncbi:MAG: hypothetical protein ACR2QE_20185 [Acidimicrobiales bacterium]
MGFLDMFKDRNAERLTRTETRVTELERQVAHLLAHQGVAVPDRDLTEVRNELAAGHKVDAIKAYRAATGAGLDEAKIAVEDMAAQSTEPA